MRLLRDLAGVLGVCLCLIPAMASAEAFKAQASRVEDDLYELDNGAGYAVTENCRHYASREAAIVDWGGGSGEIIFSSRGETCGVKALLGKSSLMIGVYRVTVSRAGDNLYYARREGRYLVTRFCFEYAINDEAILDWNGFGGELVFKMGGRKCDVERVLAPLR